MSVESRLNDLELLAASLERARAADKQRIDRLERRLDAAVNVATRNVLERLEAVMRTAADEVVP